MAQPTFRQLGVLPLLTAIVVLLLSSSRASAQTYTPDAGINLARQLRRERILSASGEKLMIGRIQATTSHATPDHTLNEGPLWWVNDRHRDTVTDLSRASILYFLVYCFAGESHYRSGWKEQRALSLKLGIWGKLPVSQDTDSAESEEFIRKMDSVDNLEFPGKHIEDAIRCQDAPPPGWHVSIFDEGSKELIDRLGHSYVDSTQSVFGKTRTVLVSKLLGLELIDQKTARLLYKGISVNRYHDEQRVIAVAYARACRKQSRKSGR